MDKNAGYRMEKTKTEIDVLNQEKDKEESLGALPKQLCAKDTSHGRVSEMLIKENGIQRANILYRPNKVMNGEIFAAAAIPAPTVQIGWKRKAVAADIIRKNIREKATQNQKESETSDPWKTKRAGRPGSQEETNKEQDTFIATQTETYYSPTLPPLTVYPSYVYPIVTQKRSPIFPTDRKAEKITGKKSRESRHREKKQSPSDRMAFSQNKAINQMIRKTMGKTLGEHTNDGEIKFAEGIVSGGAAKTADATANKGFRTVTDITFCHDGRKLEPEMVRQGGMPTPHTEKAVKHLKAQIKGKSITYTKKDKAEKLSVIKINSVSLKAETKNTCEEKISALKPGKIDNEKYSTSCHDGRKLKTKDIGKTGGLGTIGKEKTNGTVRGKKKAESSLCASYRALKKTGEAVVGSAQRVIVTTAVVSESMSKLSEEGGELQAVTEAAFIVKDAAGQKLSDIHTGKRAEKTAKRYEKKVDTLLERKAEIKQFTAKKKLDGTPLSKEEIMMLEKKLGIAGKKDKGKHNVSDNRNKRLLKAQKANSKKLIRTERKLKNMPQKDNKGLRRRNLSAQMRHQARNYAVHRMMDPNNDTEGTGLGGILLSIIKTGGFGFSKKVLKAIGSLLLKMIMPMIPVILAVIIVPILCLLLIVGIAGGNEEENQAHAQGTSSEADYYLSSLNVLYGHANATITGDANIMRWKAEVKRELRRQGIDISWTDMVLCMMWQESKGLEDDIMQSGGATPKASIRAGVSVLKSALAKCVQYQSNDIKLVLYCYNYGPGFADYIYREWDGVCSEEAAQARTDAMLASHPEWSVYGDPQYAQHVLQNYVFEESPDLETDSSKWCEVDKNNVNKCSLTPITSYACKFIGNKYVWGGTSLTNGCDCSGFTQQVCRHFGINIPRTSGEQSKSGKRIRSLAEARPGDLLFYAEGGRVNHVALYLGNNTIVHASNSRPYPAGGIKTTSPANYRPIVAIRRYSN